MKTNLFRTIILPLLWRGMGGGVLLLPAPAMAQDLPETLKMCWEDGTGYTLVSAEDATGASAVTYTWYENDIEVPNSNTPWIGIPAGKAPGTYTYVRKAANEECTDVPSNTWIVEVLQCFASTQTWTYGTQTWSDRVVATPTDCELKSALTSSYTLPQYKVSDGRYYYNWTCAYNNRDVFCPSPWRLPTLEDFTTLKGAVSHATLVSDWGLGGYALPNDDAISDSGTVSRYWSSSALGTTNAYALYYHNNDQSVNLADRTHGYQVRCVK